MQNPEKPIRNREISKFYAPFNERTLIGQNLITISEKKRKI